MSPDPHYFYLCGDRGFWSVSTFVSSHYSETPLYVHRNPDPSCELGLLPPLLVPFEETSTTVNSTEKFPGNLKRVFPTPFPWKVEQT